MGNNDELLNAEHQLTTVLMRLSQLRRDALLGRYDPDDFDRAVQEYREAKLTVDRVRHLVAAAAQVTPALLFARWLYRNGIINEGVAA